MANHCAFFFRWLTADWLMFNNPAISSSFLFCNRYSTNSAPLSVHFCISASNKRIAGSNCSSNSFLKVFTINRCDSFFKISRASPDNRNASPSELVILFFFYKINFANTYCQTNVKVGGKISFCSFFHPVSLCFW